MVTAHAFVLALAVAGSGETTLLEFTAPWCGPCRTMEPTVGRLSTAGYPVRKIDVDQHPDIAARFHITSLPSFVMVADGHEVDRVVGAASYARLQQMFEQAQVGPPEKSGVRGQSPDRSARSWNLLGRGRQSLSRDGPPAPAELPPRSIPTADPRWSPESNRKNSSVDRALAATVRIKVNDANGHGVGTGTVIDVHGTEALVITCGHIFRDFGGKGPITVETFQGATAHAVPASLISYNLDRDIGLVSFSLAGPIAPVPVAGSGHAIRQGAQVFSVGCDRGADPSVRQSHITAVDKYVRPPNIEVAGQPVVGRSGGGLFNAGGEMIGICNFADPMDNEGIYASLAVIHWELDRVGQRRIYQPREAALAAVRPTQPPPRTMPEHMPAEIKRGPTASPRMDDTEVICIVRSRSNPNGPNEVYILNQPSRELLNRLAGESIRAGRSELVPVEVARDSRTSPLVRAQSADR
jgi:thiol-disulfide isomerase/thioredoxin